MLWCTTMVSIETQILFDSRLPTFILYPSNNIINLINSFSRGNGLVSNLSTCKCAEQNFQTGIKNTAFWTKTTILNSNGYGNSLHRDLSVSKHCSHLVNERWPFTDHLLYGSAKKVNKVPQRVLCQELKPTSFLCFQIRFAVVIPYSSIYLISNAESIV